MPRKPITSVNFLVSSSFHFCLMRTYGSLRDAKQWPRATLTRSQRWTEIPHVKICYYLCFYQTWVDMRITNYCICPLPFSRECLFCPLLALSLHVPAMQTACSWHCQITNVLLLLCLKVPDNKEVCEGLSIRRAANRFCRLHSFRKAYQRPPGIFVALWRRGSDHSVWGIR